jgi:hypothetical protein
MPEDPQQLTAMRRKNHRQARDSSKQGLYRLKKEIHPARVKMKLNLVEQYDRILRHVTERPREKLQQSAFAMA